MKLFRSNINHENRVKKVSKELNIDEAIIEETLDIMYTYIRNKLESVELEDPDAMLVEEEFNKIFPTICIPSLGFITPSYKKYKHVMKNKNKKNEKNK